jgi:ParB/RepB/Spo0J family partition protein
LKVSPETLESLKESLKEDGQWDPIIVRSKGDGYELIAGHRRVQAAKEIGWSDIEGNVVNVSDSEALFLALKTNLMREDMNEREQGKALHEITHKFNISGKELAKRLGKTAEWVNSRIRLAMKLSDRVGKALDDNKISLSVADIISSMNMTDQEPFLLYILENNIAKEENEVRKFKKRFLNNTIYTIGHDGRKTTDFIQVLKENGIEYVLDIRFSSESLEDTIYSEENSLDIFLRIGGTAKKLLLSSICLNTGSWNFSRQRLHW